MICCAYYALSWNTCIFTASNGSTFTVHVFRRLIGAERICISELPSTVLDHH